MVNRTFPIPVCARGLIIERIRTHAPPVFFIPPVRPFLRRAFAEVDRLVGMGLTSCVSITQEAVRAAEEPEKRTLHEVILECAQPIAYRWGIPDVEELVNEAWIELHDTLPRCYHPGRPLRGYVRRAVWNVAQYIARERRRILTCGEDVFAQMAADFSLLSDTDNRDHVDALLRTAVLTPVDRAVVTGIMCGDTTAEIATLLGCHPSAVRHCLGRIRARLGGNPRSLRWPSNPM